MRDNSDLYHQTCAPKGAESNLRTHTVYRNIQQLSTFFVVIIFRSFFDFLPNICYNHIVFKMEKVDRFWRILTSYPQKM